MQEQAAPKEQAAIEYLVKVTELPLGEYMAITRAQADVEAYLGQYIKRFSTVLPGAFARRTMISPLAGSEIDMLVLFNIEASRRFHPSDLIQKLLVTLLAKYPGTREEKLRQCIVVPVADFVFHLRPGFLDDRNRYLLPSQFMDEWMEYDSLAYKTQFNKDDSAQLGKINRVVRLMKAWNRRVGRPFDGYFLEIMVWEQMRGRDSGSYAETLNILFKSAMAEAVFRKNDPACKGMHVDGLRDIQNLVDVLHKLKNGYLMTKAIIELEKDIEYDDANLLWRRLFPDIFPTDLDLRVDEIKTSGLGPADALRQLLE
jgi:hypothetical protein